MESTIKEFIQWAKAKGFFLADLSFEDVTGLKFFESTYGMSDERVNKTIEEFTSERHGLNGE